MQIEDVVHYVPIVGSSLSSDGRFVVVATPVYSEDQPLRPVLSRVLDLEQKKRTWKFLNPGVGVESLYNPSIAPDSERFAAFRYSNALLDIAVGRLDSPEAAPQALTGLPEDPSALKWRGLPGQVTCLGTDPEGTRRIWVWSAGTKAGVPLTPEGRSVFDYAFSASQQLLGWIEQKRQDSTSAMLHVSDDRGESGFSIPLKGTPVGFLAWAPDGTKLAYMGRPEGNRLSRSEVWVVTGINQENVQPKVTCVTEELEGWITGFDWNRTGSAIILAVEQGTYGRLARMELDHKEVEWLGEEHQFLSGPSLDRSKGQMIFLRQDGSLPQQLYLQSGKTGKPKPLTRFNRRFEQRERFESETIHWTAKDGTTLDGIWIEPKTKGPHPTLVWVHGGPAEHINRTFSPYFQALTAQGWAIFAPNYRGSTGRSTSFLRANVGDLCGEDVEDVLSGIDEMVSRGRADGDKITAMGWSYGGSLCLMAAARSSLFKALVVVAPVVDWVAIFGAQRFPSITREYFEHDVWENRTEYDNRSPVTFASDIQVPTLFMHGALDPLVPPSQSVLMERMLRGQGVETEFHLYPGEFHVFLQPASILRMLTMVTDWIKRGQ